MIAADHLLHQRDRVVVLLQLLADSLATGCRQSPNPIADGSDPEDRVAAREQEITREDSARVRQMNDDIALGVGRSEFMQLDGAIPEGQLGSPPRIFPSAGCGECRRSRISRPLFHAGTGPYFRDHANWPSSRRTGRGPLLHLVGTGLGCDDARAFHQRVAEGVVPIGVGVDENVDVRRFRHRLSVGLEHVAGQRSGEQGVDQKCSAFGHDQSAVAPPPRSVALDIGEKGRLQGP